MAFLYDNDSYEFLTTEAIKLLQWLQDANDAWSYRRVVFPFTSSILETITKHRYNANVVNYCGRDPYYSQRRPELSEQAKKSRKDYKILTAWMFKVKEFSEIYADWIGRFNEEARSISRSYPYLFKGPNELLYGSLITKSLQNTKRKGDR